MKRPRADQTKNSAPVTESPENKKQRKDTRELIEVKAQEKTAIVKDSKNWL